MTLHDLPLGASARILAVVQRGSDDAIGQRLGELGFVPGETLRVVAHGPLGREPIAVQLGYTRFALRRSEAERVTVARIEAV
ncbi:MAG: FeoA family protein [Burkholderiales bacterium]